MIDKPFEHELRFLAVAADRASEGIAVADIDGVLRFANLAWAIMHGYKSANELLGKHISSFHTKKEMEALVADFIEEAKRRGQFAGPVEHVRSNGTVFPTQTRMSTVKVNEGKTIGLVIFASDASGHSHIQHHLSQQP
jgi:PAS domain S-box-containing protein